MTTRKYIGSGEDYDEELAREAEQQPITDETEEEEACTSIIA